MFVIRLSNGNLAQRGGGLAGKGTMTFHTRDEAQAVCDYWSKPKTKEAKEGFSMIGGVAHHGATVEEIEGHPPYGPDIGIMEQLRHEKHLRLYHEEHAERLRDEGKPLPMWAFRMGIAREGEAMAYGYGADEVVHADGYAFYEQFLIEREFEERDKAIKIAEAKLANAKWKLAYEKEHRNESN